MRISVLVSVLAAATVPAVLAKPGSNGDEDQMEVLRDDIQPQGSGQSQQSEGNDFQADIARPNDRVPEINPNHPNKDQLASQEPAPQTGRDNLNRPLDRPFGDLLDAPSSGWQGEQARTSDSKLGRLFGKKKQAKRDLGEASSLAYNYLKARHELLSHLEDLE